MKKLKKKLYERYIPNINKYNYQTYYHGSPGVPEGLSRTIGLSFRMEGNYNALQNLHDDTDNNRPEDGAQLQIFPTDIMENKPVIGYLTVNRQSGNIFLRCLMILLPYSGFDSIVFLISL